MKRVGEDGFSDWQDAVEKDFEVQAAPGTCLTIVAAAEGTDELELSLVLRLPMPTPSMPDMVVAQDALQGPRAVLGPHPNCFRSPLPIPIAMVGRIKAQGTRGAVMWRVLQR